MLEPLLGFSNYHFNPHALPVMLAGILIFLIGIFIFVQTKKAIKNVAFFLFCMSSALWLFTMGFVYCANSPELVLKWYKPFTFFGVINLMPNLYLFSVASSGLLKQQRVYVICSYIFTYGIYLLALTTDKFITTPTPYSWGLYPHYELPTLSFLISFAIVFVASQMNLWVAYKREKVRIKKNQILTIMWSLLFGFTAFIDFVPKFLTVSIYPTGFLSMFILTSLLAYSIIRYKAFNIETVIHKTILWVLSFAIISLPICILYQVLFPLIKESTFLQYAFGMLSFVAFTLYLRLVQPRIDHIFQRRKANLEEISSQFAQDLVQLEGIQELVQRIEETIAHTMYPQRMDIFIHNKEENYFILANKKEPSQEIDRFPLWKRGPGGFKDDGPENSAEFKGVNAFLTWLEKFNKIVYKEYIEIDPEYAEITQAAKIYFGLTEAIVVIPLVLNDQLLGFINLDKKASLKRYNAVDFNFLTTLKNQSAIAISNSLMYQNIEEQVKQRTDELVDTQKQLIQAEKLATVGTLSGGVAHEINNPLAAILTNVQMLLDYSDAELSDDDKESLGLIEEATQRCRVIVQKLMTYAKKPQGSGEEMTAIALSDVLKKVVAFLHYQLEQDGIKIISEWEEGDYFVMGNYNELEQVITNLILNARDAILGIKKIGSIYIGLSKSKDQYEIIVKDEGEGIPQDVIPKIFDPFFTTKDVGKGVGLGLSVCQSIIEKHSGKITVQSTPGEGATFIISLQRGGEGERG